MAPEFIAVGHVTHDRFDGVIRPGGSALYAAVTAARLGLAAGILTSHGPDFPRAAIPRGIEVAALEAPVTTAFEHRHEGKTRTLRVLAAARPLGVQGVPSQWRDPELVLLAPVLNEVDPGLVLAFEDTTTSAAVQGWLRRVDPDGVVTPGPWTPSGALLGRLQVIFLSAEDIRGREESLMEWVQHLPLTVVTAGAAGALLFVNGQRYQVRPRPARAVDPTGAGDVFAAAFLVEYRREGDPFEAAAAAAVAASLSVEGEGWSAVPDRPTLEAALATYRRAG